MGLSSCWPATSFKVQTGRGPTHTVPGYRGGSKNCLTLKSSVCPEGSQTSLLPYKCRDWFEKPIQKKPLGFEEFLTCIDNMDSCNVSELKCNTFQVIIDLVHDFMNFNALKIIFKNSLKKFSM